MAGVVGLEPTRRDTKNRCLTNLATPQQEPQSAANRKLEREKGIEPSSSAWKAAALPLSYTRIAHDGRENWRG